ncbi:f-box only protein [Anaeramoeba flamelloides]|uniref:F-box only protein n=1 Tax=Anaeramoeba flamelloides TaxID=1746091 RepID=A0AAV7YQY2_9EUKA|nr:f-box only protein [Anaeramoeba flamelloides]
MSTKLFGLPSDLLLVIFDFLDWRSLLKLSGVNSFFLFSIHEENFWKERFYHKFKQTISSVVYLARDRQNYLFYLPSQLKNKTNFEKINKNNKKINQNNNNNNNKKNNKNNKNKNKNEKRSESTKEKKGRKIQLAKPCVWQQIYQLYSIKTQLLDDFYPLKNKILGFGEKINGQDFTKHLNLLKTIMEKIRYNFANFPIKPSVLCEDTSLYHSKPSNYNPLEPNNKGFKLETHNTCCKYDKRLPTIGWVSPYEGHVTDLDFYRYTPRYRRVLRIGFQKKTLDLRLVYTLSQDQTLMKTHWLTNVISVIPLANKTFVMKSEKDTQTQINNFQTEEMLFKKTKNCFNIPDFVIQIIKYPLRMIINANSWKADQHATAITSYRWDQVPHFQPSLHYLPMLVSQNYQFKQQCNKLIIQFNEKIQKKIEKSVFKLGIEFQQLLKNKRFGIEKKVIQYLDKFHPELFKKNCLDLVCKRMKEIVENKNDFLFYTFIQFKKIVIVNNMKKQQPERFGKKNNKYEIEPEIESEFKSKYEI